MKNSFKELKLDELLAKRDELRKKYFDLRFQLVVGHVENPLEKRNLRRSIARVEFLILERQRAAGTHPAAKAGDVTIGGTSRESEAKVAKAGAIKVARGAK